jgi:class 3 adenylate cyclase
VEGETRYARSGELWIAYQVIGDGDIDLLWAPGWMTHLEEGWRLPGYDRFLESMASFSRLILFDRRGTGLSDRVLTLGSFEELMEDITAVLDAAGSERTAMWGGAEGGPMCMLYAATYPSRVSHLILTSTFARRSWAPDFPHGLTEEMKAAVAASYRELWGRAPFGLRLAAPSVADDPILRRVYSKYLRYAATPGMALRWFLHTAEIDVRHVLSAIRMPVLIQHATHDQLVPVELGRDLASRLPHARFMEVGGADHAPIAANVDEWIDEAQEFLTGSRSPVDPERVLATVLFTDIVGSTERAADVGDRAWRALLVRHRAVVRDRLEQFRGREVDTAGDGFLALFDGPARAVRCALAIAGDNRRFGLEIRAGLHTGEVELIGDDVGGIAVHIGARVAGLAGPSEVLVSSTVKDLVVGSGLHFEDRGAHALKGVPDQWHVYAASGEAPR